ncbi:porin [Burkholderia gladioli]|uniref:porin n=1 Tax=Burkholderia gladioli TaxID=28095 RepID=UPI00163E4DF7|nr:porin [Burkholderia gladioli]
MCRTLQALNTIKHATRALGGLALLTSVSVHAQSNITLYGTIDISLSHVGHARGKDNLWLLGNSSMGNLTGSSWGLKGSEDLGGGLKAIFQLENGFDPGNGQLAGGRLFGNQAFVGLASERYGTLTLGRRYDPLVDLVQGITAGNDFGSAFATAGDVDNYDNSFRVNNAVKYASPALSGLRFEAMYAFGGVAGRVGAGQSYSAGLAYELGPFSLAGGYFQAANTPTKARWREDWAGTSDGTFNGPVNTAYASARSIGITRVAGRYVLGAFTFGAGYSHARYGRDGSSSFRADERFDTGQGFLTYQANAAWLIGAGYSYTKSGGDSSASYRQLSLGSDYMLSKRTDLYVTAAYQHARGRTGGDAGSKPKAQASIGSYGYAGTSVQTLLNLGVRHRF